MFDNIWNTKRPESHDPHTGAFDALRSFKVINAQTQLFNSGTCHLLWNGFNMSNLSDKSQLHDHYDLLEQVNETGESNSVEIKKKV